LKVRNVEKTHCWKLQEQLMPKKSKSKKAQEGVKPKAYFDVDE
jgi:hypothetical protein